MADLIDRAEAIKAIEDLRDCYNGFSDSYDKACIIGVLQELPSAERCGKWIESGKDWLNCSVCDEPVRKLERDTLLRNDSYYHYCPNCGARMTEADE